MSDFPHEVETIVNEVQVQALPRRQSLITQTFNHFLASILASIDIPSNWLCHIVNGPSYILNVVPFALLVEPLLFWQPRLHLHTFNRVVDGEENLYLEHLIEDAKTKIKISTILLTLAFTMMQIFFNGSWIFLGAVIYMAVMSLFISIILQTIAILCYQAILQNPGGPARLMSDARAMRGTPLALNPWIALSIPSAWTFWAFVLFFMAMVMTPWGQSLTPSPTLSGRAMGKKPQPEVIASALIVLTLGMMCAIVVVMTWRRYMGYPRQTIEH
ncbi:hypothetical protein GALMADRAFT_252783 [Galerina marginata CBS 339.88]|uniref:Uncharacterized protein n=1 Tax=Galerina marginata (strain CBS 339.88) TaxID=685588 RepID=A0A067T0T1_GALM3|nr:hypothetical protein GALMADRAFT_252783 [Galerina marginata CBS 339.88]